MKKQKNQKKKNTHTKENCGELTEDPAYVHTCALTVVRLRLRFGGLGGCPSHELVLYRVCCVNVVDDSCVFLVDLFCLKKPTGHQGLILISL